MPRPHPVSPFAAVRDAQAAIVLTLAVSEAARDYQRTPDMPPWRVGALASGDAELFAVWRAGSDGVRRDVLTAVAELAVRKGGDPRGLQPLFAHDVYTACRVARDLFDLATEEVTAPGDPAGPLVAEAPWEMATGPTGVYAMSVVCDSSEPEMAKLAAAVALSAAAQRVRPPSNGGSPGEPC